jgi:syndecan 4
LAIAAFVALAGCSTAMSMEAAIDVPVMNQKLDTLLIKLKAMKGECKLDEEDKKFVAQSRADIVFQNAQDVSTASIKTEMRGLLPVKTVNTIGDELDLVDSALVSRKAARVKAQKVVVACEAEIARIEAEVCCPNDCSGHGDCDYTNGVCTCHWGYQDLDCGTLCPTTERGICNDGGVCVAGECRCEPGFAGSKCEHECPMQCSGQGHCELCGTDSARCLCNVGFAGNDCAASAPGFWKNEMHVAVECPAGYFLPCNGHGDCSPTDGKCHCNPKYTGFACEQQKGADSAPEKESYYYQPALAGCQMSGGGDAIAAEEEEGVTTSAGADSFWECEFEDGYHLLVSLHGKIGKKVRIQRVGTGALSLKNLKIYTDNTNGDDIAKNECCHGYFEEAGECKECPGGAANPCSMNGECTAQVGYEQDSAVCACHYGFVGAECQHECPQIDGIVCGNYGKCIAQDGAAQCICTEHGHEGEFCDQCGHGYSKQADGSCKPCPGGASAFAPGGAGQICNNRGSCNAAGVCECEAGFEGEACQTRVSTSVTYSTSACGATCADGEVSLSQQTCGSSSRSRRSRSRTPVAQKFTQRCQKTTEVRTPNKCNLADCTVGQCTTRPSCPAGQYMAARQACQDGSLGFHDKVVVTCCPTERTCPPA